MNLYCSLKQLKERYLVTNNSNDNGVFLDTIEEASRAIDSACHRHFYPQVATHSYDHDEAYLLRLDDGSDLLEVTTLKTDNTGTTLASGNFYLMAGDSYNQTPYTRIAIKSDSGATFGYSGTPQKANEVTGIWGYHNDWSNAFKNSGVTLSADISDATATSFTVSGATIAEAGQLIKVNSEYMYLISNSGGTFTVERGLNGSTAATHTSGDTVFVYEPMVELRRVTARYAAWLYKEYESPYTNEVQTMNGSMIIPSKAPNAVHRFIKQYRRLI